VKGGWLSTVGLLVLTSLDQHYYIKNIIHLCCKTSYLNEEVNCTEPSNSIRVSCIRPCGHQWPLLQDFLGR
jgi:hypothetical protein